MAAHAGNSARASDPTMRREKWGTINPRKPMTPASATLLAARRDEAARMTHCARLVSRPTARARHSPIRSALSGEIEAIYAKWFQQPVPPKGTNFDFPMSEALRALYASPNDKAFN